MNLVTEINFFPNETILRLEDGEDLTIAVDNIDGHRMTLDEFRNTVWQVAMGEIYIGKVKDD